MSASLKADASCGWRGRTETNIAAFARKITPPSVAMPEFARAVVGEESIRSGVSGVYVPGGTAAAGVHGADDDHAGESAVARKSPCARPAQGGKSTRRCCRGQGGGGDGDLSRGGRRRSPPWPRHEKPSGGCKRSSGPATLTWSPPSACSSVTWRSSAAGPSEVLVLADDTATRHLPRRICWRKPSTFADMTGVAGDDIGKTARRVERELRKQLPKLARRISSGVFSMTTPGWCRSGRWTTRFTLANRMRRSIAR